MIGFYTEYDQTLLNIMFDIKIKLNLVEINKTVKFALPTIDIGRFPPYMFDLNALNFLFKRF